MSDVSHVSELKRRVAVGISKTASHFRFDEVDALVALIFTGQSGQMFDVGAHHGASLRKLADRGWTVHAFEPDPVNRAELEASFGAYPNVLIDPRAVDTADDESRMLFRSDASSGISSLTPFDDGHQGAGKIVTVRADTYLCSNNNPTIDFLKIDAEGHDLAVLQSFPFDDQLPRAVLAEFEDAKTTHLGHTWEALADLLESYGYTVLVSEWKPIETYGGIHEWHRLHRSRPPSLNPDAWGNIIGLRRSVDVERVVETANKATKRKPLVKLLQKPLKRR